MSNNLDDSFDIETSKDEEDEIDKSEILTDIIFEVKPKTPRFKNSIFKKGYLFYRKSRVSCTLTEKSLSIQREKTTFEIKLQYVFAIQGEKESFSIFTKVGEEKFLYTFVSQDVKSGKFNILLSFSKRVDFLYTNKYIWFNQRT